MDATNSINSENQDVDKSLFDAEQFLSDFSNLREECDRLKTETQNLQLRVQQLSQELSQSQMDKQNLERHIQKETLTTKEIIWNLKMELQKSQEERLSWKEKYLDLCIKSSQTISKELMEGKLSMAAVSKLKAEKNKAKLKKKNEKRKLIENKVNEMNNGLIVKKTKMEDTINKQANVNQQPQIVKLNTTEEEEKSSQQTTDSQSQASAISLNTTLSDDNQNIQTMNIVSPVDANLHSSSNQSPVVSTDATDFYGLQPTSFDITAPGQPVSGATTFILQTSDATYCATAVLEGDQRSPFGNQTTPFEIKTTETNFNMNENIDEGGDSDSYSDENTEFNFRCSMCNFTYSDQVSLSKHMKAKHTVKTFCCKECGKIYSTKSSLAQHVHHYHRHPNKYKCSVCQKTFHRKDFLMKHEKTHTDEREFPCKQCDKRFKTRSSLSGHVNGSHNEKRRFVCDFCGMRTSWRLSHLEHMKLHTGEPRNSMRRKKAQTDQQQQQEQQTLAETLQYVTTPGTVVQFISAD